MNRPVLAASCLAALAIAGCHTVVSVDDPHTEMAPLPGGGEMPTVENRFPKSRGGYYPTDADEPSWPGRRLDGTR